MALSPILTPQFFLISPSILIVSVPLSSPYAGHTMATVRLLPIISTTSPIPTLSLAMISESILTLLRPTSLCLASATLSTTAPSPGGSWLAPLSEADKSYTRLDVLNRWKKTLRDDQPRNHNL